MLTWALAAAAVIILIMGMSLPQVLHVADSSWSTQVEQAHQPSQKLQVQGLTSEEQPGRFEPSSANRTVAMVRTLFSATKESFDEQV